MSGNGDGDALKIQQQVRENAEELNDFLRGFSAWREEMQQKDRQLLEASRRKKKRNLELASGSSPQPPEPKPRKLSSPPPPNVPSPMKTDGGKSPKIKAYDYDAWSKFDAEKACDEVDKPETESSANRVSEARSGHLKQRAVAEKDRGNEFFKKGKFHEAIKCYSNGIQCDPTNAILPANRAMASLKLGLFSSAEDDCTFAISLDHTYVKAFQRRATARASLKKYQAAINDWEKVLELEKSNAQAKTEIEKLKSLNRSSRDGEPGVAKKSDRRVSFEDSPASSKEIGISTRSGVVQPILKQSHQRSKKPLKRIDIDEIQDDVSSCKTNGIKTKESEFLIREVSTKTEKPKIEEVKMERLKIEEVSSTENEEPANVENVEPTKSKGFVRKVETDILKKSEGRRPEKPNVSEGAKTVTSSVGFINFWKTLSRVEDKFEFLILKMETCKTYPKIFRSSMESWIFEDIVEVLNEFKESRDLSQHVYGLSMVPRIAAIVMFMDDKSKLNNLVNAVLRKSTLKPSEAEAIRKNLQ